MKPKLATALAALGLLSAAPSASAGVYADDMARCLIKSSSADDQIVLVRWMFSTMTLHPAVGDLANISDQQRQEMSNKAAALFERLITVDCHAESVAALKYEGVAAFGSSFNTLGQIAARGLMTDPHVTQALSGLGAVVNGDRLRALMAEAGMQPNGQPSATPPH